MAIEKEPNHVQESAAELPKFETGRHSEEDKREREKAAKKERLRVQFDAPKEIKTAVGEKLKYVRLDPENLRSEVPITYIKGWATTNEPYEEFMLDLVGTSNRTLLSVDNPHGIDSGDLSENKKLKEAKKNIGQIPDSRIELRKTAATEEMIKNEGVKVTDIVAHSEGALQAVLYALENLEKVRNIVLIGSTGMIENDTVRDLVERAKKDTDLQNQNTKDKLAGINPRNRPRYQKIKDPESGKEINVLLPKINLGYDVSPEELKAQGREIQENTRWGLIEKMKLIAKKPLADLDSIKTIAAADIAPALEFLRAKRIRVGFIHAVDDKLMDYERVREHSSKKLMDGSYTVQGTHCSFAHNPEKHALMVADLLNGLERKRKSDEIKKSIVGSKNETACRK
ncbi:MAG: hypothetical protein WCX69_03985 [Candidatus Paceibacterota bacterium]